MAIAIFISIVTIMQNIWARIGIIVISTIITVFIFDYFEEKKMDENFKKFIKLDKYEIEHEKSSTNYTVDTTNLNAKNVHEKNSKKVESAKMIYNQMIPHLMLFDDIGADSIVNFAYEKGLLKDIEISKLNDEVRNTNNYLIIEALSVENPKFKAEHDIAKVETEKYKAPLKLYLAGEISVDSAVNAMNAIYPISPENIEPIKAKMLKFDIKKSFLKDIEKAENYQIVWGIIFTSILFIIVYLYVEKFNTPTARSVSSMFKKLQLFSSAAFSIGHGGNDAQKVMGIIGAALIASGQIQDFGQLPNWVPISCYLAIGLGTMSGGWKIVKTMGTKITKVTPLEGVAAETAGAFTLFFTGQMGIPVSTTHTITGSIIGVGATKRLSAVRWGVTSSLLVAWILTIPVSGLLAALVYLLIRLFT
jgi:phosphate/sulfate permease